MRKFTPGPWRVVLDGRFIMDGGTYVAEVLKRKVSIEEMEANANLIAAAPSMYEYIESSASAGDPTAQIIIDSVVQS